MGTSQSKRDAGGGRPLVPSWAAQDPAPGGTPQAAPADGEAQTPAVPAAAPPAAAVPALAPTARYTGYRRALGKFMRTGDRADARQAAGHWARTSVGGSRAGTARVGRAARSGGAALASFSAAVRGQAPPAGAALDVRTLAGLPAEAAIDRIVDAFCPPGILDEDLARMAMGEALAAALEGADTFDPAALDQHAVQVATLAFAAELVFVQLAGDAGQALANAPSTVSAVQRERELRSLVHEVADVVGTPILERAGAALTPEAMSGLISAIVGAVEAEMESW